MRTKWKKKHRTDTKTNGFNNEKIKRRGWKSLRKMLMQKWTWENRYT